MSKKLFVGGLSWDTDNDSLRTAFEPFGEVRDAKVITDRETGRSRGFGFVEMNDAQSAKTAMESMDGAMVDGRPIRVNEAHDKPRGDRRF
jgi:RNA recognition motif-containing protein